MPEGQTLRLRLNDETAGEMPRSGYGYGYGDGYGYGYGYGWPLTGGIR